MFVTAVILPITLLFAFIRFVPIAQSLITSFYQKNLVLRTQVFIGIDNYKFLLGDQFFIKSLSNTMFVTLFATLFSVSIGLLLASVVNSVQNQFVRLGQAILFLPVVISMVPATLIWKYIFDYNFGLLNHVSGLIGIPKSNWLNDPNLTRWAVIIISTWKEIGYNMMIFLVGLKAIPRELYESASLDGAGKWHKFWSVTFPQLKPITLFVIIVETIKFVKVFTQAIVLTTGSQSSGEIFYTMVYYLYQTGFHLRQIGLASAASIILLLLVMLLTWIQMVITKER
ncbi:MAG: sugar ABC transporter permease [Bacteroidales bacterium]|nr:sugar ABC transporter permease [Bacteroidales bacterium]